MLLLPLLVLVLTLLVLMLMLMLVLVLLCAGSGLLHCDEDTTGGKNLLLVGCSHSALLACEGHCSPYRCQFRYTSSDTAPVSGSTVSPVFSDLSNASRRTTGGLGLTVPQANAAEIAAGNLCSVSRVQMADEPEACQHSSLLCLLVLVVRPPQRVSASRWPAHQHCYLALQQGPMQSRRGW